MAGGRAAETDRARNSGSQGAAVLHCPHSPRLPSPVPTITNRLPVSLGDPPPQHLSCHSSCTPTLPLPTPPSCTPAPAPSLPTDQGMTRMTCCGPLWPAPPAQTCNAYRCAPAGAGGCWAVAAQCWDSTNWKRPASTPLLTSMPKENQAECPSSRSDRSLVTRISAEHLPAVCSCAHRWRGKGGGREGRS